MKNCMSLPEMASHDLNHFCYNSLLTVCYERGRLILVSDITEYIQQSMKQLKWRVNEETGMLHLCNITDLMHCCFILIT